MSQAIPTPLDCIDNIENYLYDEVPRAKTGRMIHIGVLRQTNSYNIFTTEGTELNLESTSATLDSVEKIKRIVMFKRKQVAAERRTGKQKLRALHEQHGESTVEKPLAFGNFTQYVDDDSPDLCRLHDNLCGYCVDCKLYGFANAKADGSRDSRIQTDSAFSIRGLERREDIDFNAQSESIEAESSTALNSRAHSRPETYFPSIVTLYDVTWRELYWVLHLVRETTRYGAETSRTGYVNNEIIGLWPATSETMSNLALTKRMYDYLMDEDGEVRSISASQAREAMISSLPRPDASGILTPEGTDTDGNIEALLSDVDERLKTDPDAVDFLETIHANQHTQEE